MRRCYIPRASSQMHIACRQHRHISLYRLYSSNLTVNPNTEPLNPNSPLSDPDAPKFSRPGPIPLGDKAQQREFEELVKRGHPGVSESEVVSASTTTTSTPERHPDAEKEPLPEWEDGRNPNTGEYGGPRGVEPTRYGDWERKGR